MLDIPGYEGAYRATEGGQIWSAPRQDSRGNSLPGKPMSRYPKIGRGYVSLTLQGCVQRHPVGRLVALAYHGEPIFEHRVVHLNGVIEDTRPVNLAWSKEPAPLRPLRPVVGHPGYSVSDDGRVWTDQYRVFLSQAATPAGHRMVSLRGKSRLVHQLVLEAFVGPKPPGQECLHYNGDPSDNRLENLRWGTRSENVQDSIRHGTHKGYQKRSKL